MIDERRPIIVTSHAVQTYQRRRADKRSFPVLEEEIRQCVETGIEKGLVFETRPPGFLLWGRQKKNILPPGQRFIQCDQGANYGFIVKRTTDEGEIVITTLTRAGVHR
jgi:hypothetical protein